MAMIARSDQEIDDQLNQAMEGEDEGSKWPGMSYEAGVRAALDWVLGHSDEPPMTDE